MGRRTFRLLRGHYSSFFAPTDSFASRSGLSSTSVYRLVGGVFAGCHQSLLPAGPSRRYLPRIFPWMLDPVPRRFTACSYLFSSAVSSAFPTRSWVGFTAIFPLETTSCGTQISGRQIFLYVPASNFVLPPRSSLPLRVRPQGSRGFYLRAERASLPPHAPDMLTVRIRQLTVRGLSPR